MLSSVQVYPKTHLCHQGDHKWITSNVFVEEFRNDGTKGGKLLGGGCIGRKTFYALSEIRTLVSGCDHQYTVRETMLATWLI